MTAWFAFVRVSLRELTASRALVALAVVIVVLVAALNATLIGYFAVRPAAAAGGSEAVALWLGVAGYVAAVVTPGTVGSVLFTVPLVRQQASGRIVALTASCLSPRQIWLGYATALWLVEMIVGVVVTAAVLGALWLVAQSAIPAGGVVSVDGGLLLGMIVIVPLVFAALVAVMTQVGLTASAAAGNVIGIVSYATMASTFPRILGQGVSVEVFLLINVGIVVIGVLAAVVLGSRTTALRMAAVTG